MNTKEQIDSLAADVREQCEGMIAHWMGQHVPTHDNFGRLIVSPDYWIGKQESRYADLRLLDCLEKVDGKLVLCYD